MIVRTKEDLKSKFPSFYLNDQVLNVVTKVKYLGHVIRNDLNDDDDIQRQCCKLYGQANVLARKFYMCTEDVKIGHTVLLSIQATCCVNILELK